MIGFPLRVNTASWSLHSTMCALMRKKCRSQMIRNRFLHLDRSVHRELLKPPWAFIASRTKTKAPSGEREIDEWLTTYATAELKKAGKHAFYEAKKDNLCPFKQTHVRHGKSVLISRAT
jgi:hypothetical protein